MKTLLLGLLCTFSFLLTAQEISTFPEIPMTDFNAFDVDGERIVALGSCDQIWYTSDAGEKWTYLKTPVNFYDVKFIPDDVEQRVILAGEDVYLFDFENGFIQDFNNESLFDESNFYRNIEINNEEVFIVGPDQVIGASLADFEWSETYRDTFSEDYIYTAELFGNQMYIGGRFGNLVKLNIDNQEWDLVQELDAWIQRISMGSEQVGYISASGIPDVIKTSDGWNSMEMLTELPENIRPTAYGENIVITVNTNRIYLSTDGGQTAEYIQTANTPEFSLTYAGMFTENGDLYFAGRGAMMTKSTDFGNTWTPLNAYNRSNLYAVDSDEEGTAIITGENKTIYYSNDHGENWVEKSLDFTTDEYLSEVVILSPNKFLVASGEHLITIENDEVVSSLEMRFDRLILNKDLNYLVGVVNMDGIIEVHKSVDEGQTWMKKFELDDYSSALSQNNTGKIYTGTPAQIFSSIDHGETWLAEDFPLPTMRDVEFWDDDYGVLVSGGGLYKTSDAGVTFEEIFSGYAIRNVHFISKDTFFFTTANSSATNLRMTENGGASFESFYSNCATTYAFSVNGKNEVILAQRDGHIQIVPLQEVIIPSSSRNLSQQITINVFPNPLSAFESFSIDGDWDAMEVYSLDGRVVYDQDYYSGSIRVPELSGGVYIVKTFGDDGVGVGKIVVE